MRRPANVQRGMNHRKQIHAIRIAKLLIRERELLAAIARRRAEIDQALLAARREGVPHKQVAFEVQRALDRPPTATELERLSECLRQRTKVATRRTPPVSSTPNRPVATPASTRHCRSRKDPTMHPYRRTIVEEFYEQPPQPTCPPPERDDFLDEEPSQRAVLGDLPDHDEDE